MSMSKYIMLHHGAGAREMWNIIEALIISKVPTKLRKLPRGAGIDVLDDGAVIPISDNEYLVFSVDSYTVNPIFFPGGNIGHLTVNGTINDLVVMGAEPKAFMDTIIVEEGFPLSDLEIIINSMLEVLKNEDIALIGGDFKVMPKGSIDKVVITGVGIGITDKPIIDKDIKPGDKIILTSPIAEHGAAILAAQLGLLDEVKNLRSDSRPLSRTLLPLIKKYKEYVHAARDPTRGGIAAVLNEWVRSSNLLITIHRDKVPIREDVKAFLEAMGVDPLSMASEGSAVLAVDGDVAEEFVKELRSRGEDYATIIGEVTKPGSEILKGRVLAITEIGGKIILEPKSVNLPRIC